MSKRYMALGFLSDDSDKRFRNNMQGLVWHKIEVPQPDEVLTKTIEDEDVQKIITAMHQSDVLVEYKDGNCSGAVRMRANNMQVPNDMLTWIAADTDIADLPVTNIEELQEELAWLVR